MISDPYTFLITSVFLIPASLLAIPAHELGHALVAYAQGDPTPRNRGFLRPDPRLFFNVYGVVAMFLIRVAWGEPVPINEYRLRGLWGRLTYALGGPAANLVLAGVFGVVLRSLLPMAPFSFSTIVQPTPLAYLSFICYAAFILNLSMFAFNLLPIPGLDGWRVAEALFRGRNPRFFFEASSRRQTVWIVCAVVYFAASFLFGLNLLNVVMLPFYAPASTLIVGTCAGYPPSLFPCPRLGGF